MPFTHFKQHAFAQLDKVFFDPKQNTIVWRSEKTLKVGTQPEVTIVTGKTVIKYVDEDSKQMASIGVETAHVNAYNVSKLKGAVDQYKDKMAQMKETLKKEQGEG